MFEMRNVEDVGCSGCEMFGMLGVLHVEDVRCLGCGMFGIRNFRNVG